MLAKIKAVANRGRLLHYADIFLAAFGMALLYNQQDLLGAHGLNAVKSVVFAACVAGGKAVLETYRKSHGQKKAVVQFGPAGKVADLTATDKPAAG